MANGDKPLRLAVLIDAENASAGIVEGLFEEIAKLGEASVRRIYGDFTKPGLKGWTDVLQRFAIVPHQEFAYTKGKNASDIALVIDAMSLLFSERLDGFCLVSSDSDFTRLASTIREHGLKVYGFGEQKTPESLRQACHRFVYTENLGNGTSEPAVQKMEAPSHPTHAPPSKAAPLIRTRTYGERKLSELVRKTGAFDVEQREGRLRIHPKAR